MLLKIANIFILVILFLSAGCKGKEKAARRQADDSVFLNETISKKFGENGGVELIYNKDSSLILCKKISKITPGEPMQSVHFLVYHTADQSVIFEDKLKNARVDWLDNQRLRVVKIAEMIRSDAGREGPSYALDPETGAMKELRRVEATK